MESKENKPKAFIKKKYTNGTLPDANPFKVSDVSLIDRNNKEFKEITKMIMDARSGGRASNFSVRVTMWLLWED